MVNWKYKGREVSSTPPKDTMFGFVYLITYVGGQQYIGRKNFFSIRKKPLGKKKLAAQTDKRKSKYEVITTESNWRTYNGSSKDAIGLVVYKREILEVCYDSINLTYAEAKWMFHFGVLEKERFINKNIMGKFYDGKIKNQREI